MFQFPEFIVTRVCVGVLRNSACFALGQIQTTLLASDLIHVQIPRNKGGGGGGGTVSRHEHRLEFIVVKLT